MYVHYVDTDEHDVSPGFYVKIKSLLLVVVLIHSVGSTINYTGATYNTENIPSLALFQNPIMQLLV